MTLWSPTWRSLNPWKGHLKPPKRSRGRCWYLVSLGWSHQLVFCLDWNHQLRNTSLVCSLGAGKSWLICRRSQLFYVKKCLEDHPRTWIRLVNNHGDRCCPLRIGLWDPFLKWSFFGWKTRGSNWDDPPRMVSDFFLVKYRYPPGN